MREVEGSAHRGRFGASPATRASRTAWAPGGTAPSCGVLPMTLAEAATRHTRSPALPCAGRAWRAPPSPQGGAPA